MKTKQTHDGFCWRGKARKATRKLLRDLCGIGLGLIALVVWAGPTIAQTFTPTNNMTFPRMGHTATLLKNGMVLIAGGQSVYDDYSDTSILAKAELYDPATDFFTLTGDMTEPRYYPTATLLNDGKVLIAGGHIAGRSIGTAELYDAETETFTSTGSMTIDRYGHTATLLKNGKVLIAGGWSGDWSGYVVDSAELYDPTSGTFTATDSMTTPRNWPTATLLNNGKVLLVGGNLGYWGGSVASAELYDPITETFTATGNMTKSREWSQTTLLNNGKVLIAGGWSFESCCPYTIVNADLYDPSTGTFTPTASLLEGRSEHQATLLKDKVLIAGGGVDPGGYALASAELYDPTSGAFTSTGSMTTPRSYFTATRLNNGKVLVAGGGDLSNQRCLDSAELYTPPANEIIVTVNIDINPWLPNLISLWPRWGFIPVAILSTADFDAPSLVDQGSLTFGATGDEASFGFCNQRARDVNRDGYHDLVCHFFKRIGGFQCGDIEGILKGMTTDGTPIEGRDSVMIVPCKCKK